MSYTILNGSFFAAIEAQANGWVAIGIDPRDPATFRHQGADIIMGAFNTTSSETIFSDKYGASFGDIKPDIEGGGTNDIEIAVANENLTWTTFEFKRNLITDDLFDNPINPDTDQTIMYAYHKTSDFTVRAHSVKGYTLIVFHEDTFIPPSTPPPTNNQSINYNTTIDGIVSANEYPYSQFLDSLYKYRLSYNIVSESIYLALEVQALGWVAIGIDPTNPSSTKHLGADIFLGAFVATSGSTIYSDEYANVNTNHKSDLILGGTDDIIDVKANEHNAWTTIEFRRNLSTEDVWDNSINLETQQIIMWAYHRDSDDLTRTHSARGYTQVIFHETTNASTSTEVTEPLSPLGLTAIPKKTQIDLSWLQPSNNGNSRLTNYNVYRHLSNESIYMLVGVSTTETSFIDNNVLGNITYYYIVRAENSVGESQNSNEVVTKLLDNSINSVESTSKSSSQISETANAKNNADNSANLSYSLPIGLGWAFLLPVLYIGTFFGFIILVKLKIIKSHSLENAP